MENQPESTLLELIRYNNWANAQVLAACQELAPDQLAAAAPGAYGTIRETLGHIIRAEADYVGRLTGNHPRPAYAWKDQPTPAELSATAEQEADAQLDAIRRIPPTSIVLEE
jgi:uncharacterized damage-inducible protein DinB